MAATIPEFFAGKKVLITGATGFLGKVLVEKLLRCCPNIDVLYLMVRPKRGQPPQQRIQDIIGTQLFDKVREENPSSLERIIAVNSDMLEPGLGLSDEDREMLQQEVGVVFHIAATIKFDEMLKLSYQLNVNGLMKLLTLCKGMKKLEAFVHTSTAYCMTDELYIEEKIYPPPIDHRKLDDVINWMDDEMINAITPKLIHPKPNTYTFTKAIAEHVLMEDSGDIAISIVRPSIVGAAWKEPIPGWVDNFNGASGLMIACGKGLLRIMKANPSAVADIVPVDITVNVMIAAAWNIGVLKPTQIPIYNITTGGLNPFTWGDMANVIPSTFNRLPLDNAIRRPDTQVTHIPFIHDYWQLVSHTIPSYLYDVLLRLLGKRATMVRLFNKMTKAVSTMECFTTNTWQWSTANTDVLATLLSEQDNKVFFSDVRSIDWPSYLEDYCLGTKQFVLKEPLSELPKARAHLRKIRNVRYLINTFVTVVIIRVLIARSMRARNMWYYVTNLIFNITRYISKIKG